MSFLKIDKITKAYGPLEVLHEINIDIEEGEFLVLVGPSGCGKSTLLNMIAGLEDISSGEILIRGRSMNGVHPSARNIAMVFQSYALYPNMTVAGNIQFGLEMHGVSKPERDKAVADVAQLLQITHLLDRKPGQLSGGQRQRVAMGRALVRDPDVFLFDEPLSNLDAKLRVDMRIEIKKLHQKLGRTIVYVTHDQIEALTLSTRIAVMNAGLVQQLGTAKDIYESPVNMFVASFMGSPSMNMIPARIVERDGQLAAHISNADGQTFALKLVSDLNALSGYRDREVILGIRPEAITDVDGADKTASHCEIVDSRVDVIEPAGSDTFVLTELSGRECNARMRADIRLSPGEFAPFSINMDKVIAFDPDSEQRIFKDTP